MNWIYNTVSGWRKPKESPPSPPPPKMHYCVDHQGDGAHYARENCHLCKAILTREYLSIDDFKRYYQGDPVSRANAEIARILADLERRTNRSVSSVSISDSTAEDLEMRSVNVVLSLPLGKWK